MDDELNTCPAQNGVMPHGFSGCAGLEVRKLNGEGLIVLASSDFGGGDCPQKDLIYEYRIVANPKVLWNGRPLKEPLKPPILRH